MDVLRMVTFKIESFVPETRAIILLVSLDLIYLSLNLNLSFKHCTLTFLFLSPPSSKCLHRFNGICFLYLHSVHSILSTIFFVVFAYKIMDRVHLIEKLDILVLLYILFDFYTISINSNYFNIFL